MLKIGEFSKLSRVSIRILRHYDELGLLHPVRIDPDTGYRYYRESQLPTASRIAALRDMGFGLAAIGELLACDDPALLERHLLARRAELTALQDQTARRLRLLGTALQRLRKDGFPMNCPVTIKTFPARYAATLRMTIPSYDQEGLLWSELVRRTAPLHLVPDDPCLCAVVFHDREFRESDVDVEAQKTVRGAYPDTDGVLFRTLPPVTAATAVCRGSYAQLNDVMTAVAAWVLDNGYTLSGPAFNLYHVSPHETSNPDEFVTEVCYPIAPTR